jgi:hypothetical protein
MSIASFVTRPFQAAKETVGRYENQNPHTAGQVRATVGGVLLADGLVGLEDPFDNKKSRPGILGSLTGMGISVVFIVVGIFIMGTAAETDSVTDGTIASISEPSKPDSQGKGGGACSLTANFVVDGRTYSATTDVSSSGNCNRGINESIEVKYNSANPNENSVGMSSGKFGLIFAGIGALVFIPALFTFAIRLASIIFGLRLLMSGRKMMAENPKTVDDAGIIAESKQVVINLLKGRPADAAISNQNVGRIGGGLAGGLLGNFVGGPLATIAGGAAGAYAGDRLAAQADAQQEIQQAHPAQIPGRHAAAVPPVAPPVSPPAAPAPPTITPGWYATADGTHERWHDGTGWTEHTRSTGAPV